MNLVYHKNLKTKEGGGEDEMNLVYHKKLKTKERGEDGMNLVYHKKLMVFIMMYFAVGFKKKISSPV
jgi:hypothetical protein